MESLPEKSIFTTENLSFYYEEEEHSIFTKIRFAINKGESILLLGPSGSGKSTLAYCLNKLYPEAVDGILEGSIHFEGKALESFGPGEINKRIGMVFQDPESQFCMPTVEDEIAFGLENIHTPPDQIDGKIDSALKLVGLSDCKKALIHSLSGGQKQKLALACVLALQPEVLILDEPTANLDPASSRELAVTIERLKAELSLTLIVIEHNLGHWIDIIDRCLVLNRAGELLFDGDSRTCFTRFASFLQEEGVWLPAAVEAGARCEAYGLYTAGPLPLSIDELIGGLREPYPALDLLREPKLTAIDRSGSTILDVKGISYSRDGEKLVDSINFTALEGEFIAIVGPNGSGKTTLSRLIAGLLSPSSGQVLFENKPLAAWQEKKLRKKMGYVFQNPEHQLITDHVFDEIAFGLRLDDVEEKDMNEKVRSMLKKVRLEYKLDSHPFSLSQGQKRRLSVATMLVLEQKLLLLDEPTFGQDALTSKELMKLLEGKTCQGETVLFITHDMELVDRYADKVLVLHQGSLLFDGSPDTLWNQHDIIQKAHLQLPFIEKLKNRIDVLARRENHAAPRN